MCVSKKVITILLMLAVIFVLGFIIYHNFTTMYNNPSKSLMDEGVFVFNQITQKVI